MPEPLIQGPAARVMSLRDGMKKMSKSDPSEYSRISLSDDADTIAQKVRKAKTDPEPLPTDKEGLKNRPEAENLIGIYAALNDSRPTACCNNSGVRNFRRLNRRLPISPSQGSARSARKCGGWRPTRPISIRCSETVRSVRERSPGQS